MLIILAVNLGLRFIVFLHEPDQLININELAERRFLCACTWTCLKTSSFGDPAKSTSRQKDAEEGVGGR